VVLGRNGTLVTDEAPDLPVWQRQRDRYERRLL